MDVLKPLARDIKEDICDLFISAGLSNGTHFEEEFMKNNPKMFGFLVDKLDNRIIFDNKKLVHINQALSTSKTLMTENLDKFFKSFNRIYLKLNIKGYEIEYFKSLTSFQINKIEILNIELYPDTNLTVPKLLYSTHILSSMQKNKDVLNCIFVKGTRNIPVMPEPQLEPIQPERHMLTVYSCPFPKIRLGRHYDGGYIIANIPKIKYSVLIAAGINDDISFEEDFLKKYKSLCFAFDGTIDNLPYTDNTSINFIKKNIGTDDNDNETNLHKLLADNTNLFLKMDIEGGEVGWISCTDSSYFNRIDQIAIEFHRSSIDKNTDIFNKLNETHVLIHLHPNNCCGVRKHNDLIIPYIFECTYIHKRFFTSPPTLNKEPIPSSIDMKNLKYKPDIVLNFPPYVN